MKILKRLSLALAGIVMAVLTVATVLEKVYGTEFVAGRIYGAWWFAALWVLLAAVSLAYVFRRGLLRRPAVFLLHFSFVVILAGAGLTWLFGEQGTVHLRTDGPHGTTFTDKNGVERPLPFSAGLDGFRIEYYEGTRAPMDFVSNVTLSSDGDTLRGEVAMNRILVYRSYRFYQSSYDEDGGGATLRVAHDPWGIGITYGGYLLLLLSMTLFFTDRKSRFRRLLRGALCVLFLVAGTFSANAAQGPPQTLPRDLAAELGGLAVCYNDRICPLGTLAKEFTVKLTGKSSYRGYTPEQVLAGWLFYYDDWKREPMIRIKNPEVRRLLGLEGRYASLAEFNNSVNEYLLPQSVGPARSEADEQFNIIGMLCTGRLLRLLPYADPGDGTLRWASQADDLPRALPHEQRLFIGRVMNYMNELVARRDFDAVRELLRKIGAYQRQTAPNAVSVGRLRAEIGYNKLQGAFWVAGAMLLTGLAAFVYTIRRTVGQKRCGRLYRIVSGMGLAAGFLFLSGMLGLRGYVCGHWPLSNGYETMQFMAWCTLLLTLLFRRRFAFATPFGFLVAGLALLVSAMSSSNPQITPLMPVLHSPLLSVHVMLVMVAYALLAFAMCNGVTGLILCRRHPDDAARLAAAGRLLLYPAVFALAAGIFVGAVWANISWGRYWGWDPKEVWALITLMIYALALHSDSLPWLRRPVFFHLFCAVAFLSVLVTYFGVNFLLNGLHSYAS